MVLVRQDFRTQIKVISVMMFSPNEVLASSELFIFISLIFCIKPTLVEFNWFIQVPLITPFDEFNLAWDHRCSVP